MKTSSMAGALLALTVLAALGDFAYARDVLETLPRGAARALLQKVKEEPAVEGTKSLPEIEALFVLWNKTLQTGDPAQVADLYLPNGVLLATLSNTPRTNTDMIKDYFVSFLKKKPSGTILEKHVRMLSDVTAVDSGIYEFNFGLDGSSARARYTYVYRKVNGVWKIAYHHSSVLPEALEDEIKAAFNKWNAALQTGEPEKVADMYQAEGVLLPTVSNYVRADRAAIIDYFVAFLKKKPFGTIDSGYVLDMGLNRAAYVGVYTFKFGDGSSVQARFSYMYVKEKGVWLIQDHHSSAMPEKDKPYVPKAL